MVGFRILLISVVKGGSRPTKRTLIGSFVAAVTVAGMAKAKPKGKGGKGSDRRLVGGLATLLVIGLGAKYLMKADTPASTAGPPSLYESGLSATKMDGESVSIASFKGKALLMLNVASL